MADLKSFFFFAEVLDEDDKNFESHSSKDDNKDSDLSNCNSLPGLICANSDDDDDDDDDMDESCGGSDMSSLPSLASLSDSDMDSQSDWEPDWDSDGFYDSDECCCSGMMMMMMTVVCITALMISVMIMTFRRKVEAISRIC